MINPDKLPAPDLHISVNIREGVCLSVPLYNCVVSSPVDKRTTAHHFPALDSKCIILLSQVFSCRIAVQISVHGLSCATALLLISCPNMVTVMSKYG